MSKFSEESYTHWQRPASKTEEQRISNAISMMKKAVNSSDFLKSKDIDIFVQGSYGNNTNVRAESDVDVCIMLKDIFYAKYPDGYSGDDYGFTFVTNSFSTFRKEVIRALINTYGEKNIKQGNKSIKIEPNSYRVETDAVPAIQYRNYHYNTSKSSNNFVEGIKFISQDGNEVINYPQRHIQNGIEKNKETQKRYKRLVRIFKRIRYKMIADGVSVDSVISSFLIECLLWNTLNSYFNNNESNSERVRETIVYLFNKTKNDDCLKWTEVSGMLYLFRSEKRWNVPMVNNFLQQMWDYLELGN
jgi:hypothetical protein